MKRISEATIQAHSFRPARHVSHTVDQRFAEAFMTLTFPAACYGIRL
jgi:hypothetical protein